LPPTAATAHGSILERLVIEIATFRLKIDEADFVDLDARVQTEFVYRQPGIVRRTTARGPDGEWLVLTLWQSLDDAERAANGDDSRWREFLDAVDAYAVRRYTTLG
jgi:hypothetical protein